jgi:hypothetical protein
MSKASLRIAAQIAPRLCTVPVVWFGEFGVQRKALELVWPTTIPPELIA